MRLKPYRHSALSRLIDYVVRSDRTQHELETFAESVDRIISKNRMDKIKAHVRHRYAVNGFKGLTAKKLLALSVRRSA